MLAQYLSDTRLLLNDVNAEIYTLAELTGYINKARNYTASIAECVRDTGSIAINAAVTRILFNTIVPSALITGSLLVNPRDMWAEPGIPIEIRPFEWWRAYVAPQIMVNTQRIAAIYTQGVSSLTAGTIYLKNGSLITYPYTLVVDGIWLPIPLVDDTTREDIPQPWIEAVCYYTAYLAFLRVQRLTDADAMLQRFNDRLTWARETTTSSRLPGVTESVGAKGTHEAATYGTLAQPPRSQGQ